MCDPVTLGIAATALSATSTLASGIAAHKQGQYEEAQASADAIAAQSAGRVEAQRIRDITRRQRASTRAALAGAGVQVDVGTAADVPADVTQAGEQDALTAILNGGNSARRLQAEGQMAGIRGQQALFGSVLAAGGDVAYGRSKWKRMQEVA